MAISADIKKTLFKSVFLVLRRSSLPAMNKFLMMTVADLKLKESSPADWKTFWAEVLASQIQQDCRNDLKIFINNFHFHLFDDAARTMKSIADFINENQLPVE